ncbi:MAG: hypothetical protein HUJ27_09600 [Rhodobacteraceae bacterium]|nr:hypothetical protein [Paracoccaceae bacterium]
MADASRILPVVGVVLFLLPLLWTGARTASGAIYLFLVWGALILVAALLARPLDRLQREDAPPGGEDG